MIPTSRLWISLSCLLAFGRTGETQAFFASESEAGTADDLRSTPERGDPKEVEPRDEDAARRGLVVVVGGVGGLDLCGLGMRLVFRRERPNLDLRVFHWGHGFGRWYADLSRVSYRDAKAQALAVLVHRFRADHPLAPVFLVAKSGGAAIAVRAIEQLEQAAVECVVLLAPALSPHYDLSTALRAVKREMVVFWSPLDLIILGAGTRLFGTADRVHTVSAGLIGFRPAVPAVAGPYDKLRQVRWTPRMLMTGNLGGHVGPDSPIFLRKYVFPLLRAGLGEDC